MSVITLIAALVLLLISGGGQLQLLLLVGVAAVALFGVAGSVVGP